MLDWLFKKKSAPSSGSLSQRHLMLELALEDLAIREDDVVIDLGFADFEAAKELLPKLPRGRFLGVSPLAGQLAKAEAEFKDAVQTFRGDFKEGVGARIPYGDGYATAVLCLDQSHTWVNLDKALDEINRVLAPGGRFVLVWAQPLDGDTHIDRRIIDAEHMKQLLHGAGFHRPRFRERVDGKLRYYQYLVEKP